MSGYFKGFTPRTAAFFAELAQNNTRAWGEEHKAEHRAVVLEPISDLLADLAPVVTGIDPGLSVDPKRGTLSRLHRDVRFSRDKSPYHTTQWLTFKRPSSFWQDTPCYFFEVGADGYRYGMGYYCSTPATLRAVRAAIEASPEAFQRAMAALSGAGLCLEGDAYKRPKIPATCPDDLSDWYRLRSPFTVCNRPLEPLLYSPELVATVTAGFEAAAPLYRLLREAAIPRAEEEKTFDPLA